jgi:hypothetical protein
MSSRMRVSAEGLPKSAGGSNPAARFTRQIRTQQDLEFELLMGVAHQDPANGQRGYARVRPHGRSRVDQDLGQSGQALAFEAWPAILAWLPSWGRFVEGGIQPQASPDSPRRCSCLLVRRGDDNAVGLPANCRRFT